MAEAFRREAVKQGIAIAGIQSWDPKQSAFRALLTEIRASGADAIYLGGTFDATVAQLIREKVAVLGDNRGVKLICPDSFSGIADFQRMPQAEGAYVTFPGLDISQLRTTGKAAALLTAYRLSYGEDPPSAYAVYGVQALQVILTAIERSDGSRKGVLDAVFKAGITIPANDSLLGRQLTISAATGDVNLVDISVTTISGGSATFLKPITVG